MPSLADKNPLAAMRVCLVGVGGAGKTHLLGTFAKAGRVAIADADGDGVDTLLGHRFRNKYPWFEPSMVEYEKFDEPMDQYGMPVSDPVAYWKMIAWLNKMIKDPAIKTIGVDSLSAASKIAILAGMRTNAAKKRSQTWNDRANLHMLLSTQADFGAEMNAIAQLLEVVKKASQAKKHIVITAHVRENRTENGTLISREPLVTGDRLRAQFANWFSDVWFIDVVEVIGADPNKGGSYERRLITDTTPGLKGIKSRLGIPEMLDPSYEKIQAELLKRYNLPKQATPPASSPQASTPATTTK